MLRIIQRLLKKNSDEQGIKAACLDIRDFYSWETRPL